jgi:phage head maturation protease
MKFFVTVAVDRTRIRRRGKEAFANVAFFGEEQEWSIGYKTIDADYDHTHQANILKEVELYEVSPVLHGANSLTGTMSV